MARQTQERMISSEQMSFSESRLWNKYMDTKRNCGELVGLVENKEIKTCFQEKAIEILLAPDIKSLSSKFKVNMDTCLNNNLSSTYNWIEKITNEQADFIAKKIPLYIEQTERKTHEDENGSNIDEVLVAYNNLIPILLPKLSPEQAEKLFEIFNINDPFVYSGIEDEWGYNPLNNLLNNKVIDESWKNKAVEKIHTIIVQEENGEMQPRMEYERAINSYCRILKMMLYTEGNLPISKQFYQKEIAFLLQLKTDGAIVNTCHTGKVLDLLDDNKELQHNFARRQVLPANKKNSEESSVYDDNEAQTAKLIINKFPNDIEMKSYLEKKLHEYQIKSGKEIDKKQKKERKEKHIISQMKRVNL